MRKAANDRRNVWTKSGTIGKRQMTHSSTVRMNAAAGDENRGFRSAGIAALMFSASISERRRCRTIAIQ